MKQQRSAVCRRALSLVLSAVLLLCILPVSVFAKGVGSSGAAEYTVVAHGAQIAFENTTDVFRGTAPAYEVLTVTLDESLFPGKTFACWRSADGTEIQKKSFRLLVDRDAAFYPVFEGVTGNFGEWEPSVRGKYCDDTVVFVRSDDAQGLKEYSLYRGGNHENCSYERIDDGSHRKICADCPYTEVSGHWWDAGVVTTEAAHLTDGVKTYTCSYCGAKKYEKIERSNQHSYPSNPKDSDYIIDEPAVDGKPGKRHLKCTACSYEAEPSEYIVSALPGSAGKVQHFTYERTSPYSSNSSLNQARVEEHYISDTAYCYSVKKATSSYRFDFLWFDHGRHSPVYIRAGTRYGTAASNYYGIVAYADSREEFIRMINSSHMLSGYDNGRHSAMLTSEYSGSRYFEKLWNEGTYTRNKLIKVNENVTRPGWNTPLAVYEYKTGSSGRPATLYVDENNVCVYQYVGPGDTTELKFTEELDAFPFSEPERDKITWYGYQVTDGTYAAESWDSLYFGMISEETDDENRTVRPYDAKAGQYFSHWEKYNFHTKEYEYCTDAASFTPSVSDVTRLKAVFKDRYYHIKVNGGYYRVSTGWNDWSAETYTEGDVIYGKEIRLSSDSSMIPEGKQADGFTDKDGNRLDSYTFVPDADGEYTMTYKDKEAYFEANARNGVVKMNGETFSGRYFPIGAQITLTSESSDSVAYPYFIGWCRVQYGMAGEEYTVVSADAVYTATVADDYDANRIVAVWSETPTLPEKVRHNITAVKGFVGTDGVYVSDIRVVSGSYVRVVRDPSETLRVQTWIAADADTGAVIETKAANDYGTYFEISAQADGKGDGKYGQKGGKPGEGGVSYPPDIIITGKTDICSEHTWDAGVVTKEPNYAADGEKTFTCTVCGMQKTEPIAKPERYCVHACKSCGGCTLPANDASCGYERCTCATPQVPILFNQTGAVSGTPEGIVLTVVEIQADSGESAPYLNYCLEAAEGYEIENIYDVSLVDSDGAAYTLADGETATVTLNVGKGNAQAIRDGRLYVIHIATTGREIYGVGHKPITADTENGTVTFETDSFSPFLLVERSTEYYGRSALARLANKDALLYAYDQIVSGVENGAESIGIYDGTNTITRDEIKTVFDAYRRDHTEQFWLGKEYSITYNLSTSAAFSLAPTYILSGTALATAKAAFRAAVSEMLDGITSSMSEFEREKLLHDRLAAKVTYDGTAANAQNSYGAIVEGKAVCEGYAEAFQHLLRKAGIQSFIMTGVSNNPSTGTPEGHAWNAVRIDGKYYHVDTTWDDQGEKIFYAYFNKSDAAIGEDHTIHTADYALPICNSDTADYFFVNGGRLPAFDLDAVAALLANGRGTARIYVTGDKEAFAAAIGNSDNILSLAAKLGYAGGIQYGYANLGREFILTLRTTGVAVSGTVTSFLSAADEVTIRLTEMGETAPIFTTTVTGGTQNGNKFTAAYSFDAVPDGVYTMTVLKKNHVTREYAVTVNGTAVQQDVKVHLTGDVNGDGKINTSDVGKANMHAKNKKLLTEYEFACGDVNGDGRINTSDVGKINMHAKDKKLLW